MREKHSKSNGDWILAAAVLTILQVLLFLVYYFEGDFDLVDFTPKTSTKRVHLVEKEKPAGETYDYSGQYRIFRHFKTKTEFNDNGVISLITWGTLETLPYLSNVTQAWQGDTSCAIFVNFSEARHGLKAFLFSKCFCMFNLSPLRFYFEKNSIIISLCKI